MGVKLKPKDSRARGAYLTNLVDTAKADRGALMDKRSEVREHYYKAPGGEVVNEPWEGAVSLHLPIIQEKVETAVPKIVSALWRANPFVTVKAPGAEGLSRDSMKKIERFLTWAFRNDIDGFYLTLENFVRNMLIDGTAFAKIRWERKWRRGVDHHIIDTMMRKGETSILSGEVLEQDRDKSEAEILAEVFGFGDLDATLFDYYPIKGKPGVFRAKFTEGGRQYEAEVTITPTDTMHEVDVRVDRRFMSYDAPVVDLLEFEDLILPSRATSVQDASWVCHRTWYTVREVEAKVKSGEWDMTAGELSALKALATVSDEENEGLSQRDAVVGESPRLGRENPMPGKKGFNPNLVEIYEIYMEDTIDDGDPVDVIYFVSPDLDKVVATELHDDVFPHGMRPFAQSVYIPVPGRAYGIGMAELLLAINKEIDHLFSHTSNMMEMVTLPFFFYTPYGAATNENLMHNIKPGAGIATVDPNGVRFAEFAQQPLALLHASSQTLLGYADRMTFSPSVGGSSNYRNAPRTARGTLALMDAAEERLSAIVEQLQAGPWKQIVTQVSALYGMYVASEKWYTVTGDTKRQRMSTKLLRSNLQMEFSGSLTSTNRDVQRQLAERRYLVASRDPLYNSDPRARQHLLIDFLEHMSEGTDVRPITPSLPGEGGFSHVPMNQDQELDIMKHGFRVEVLPVDNHAEHLKAIESFVSTDAFRGLDPTVALIIAEHRNAHSAAHQQQVAMQNRIQQMQAGESPEQAIGMLDGGMGEPQVQQVAPEPGAPVEGIPGMGGEMSAQQGGPM